MTEPTVPPLSKVPGYRPPVPTAEPEPSSSPASPYVQVPIAASRGWGALIVGLVAFVAGIVAAAIVLGTLAR